MLVVSHPCVVAANQLVYDRLQDQGWTVHLITPARWRDEFNPDGFPARYQPALAERARPTRVILAGRPQRHLYLASPLRAIRAIRPDVAFVEQESFSLVAEQWGRALQRAGVPFGLEHDENLERPLPSIARAIRRRSLSRAFFVAARSPRAAELVTSSDPRAMAPVIPHAIPEWETPAPVEGERKDVFTVGYAGRLIEAKGIRDLLEATARLDGVRLRLFGNGPLRREVEAASTASRPVEVIDDIPHEEMARAYASMDVFVLPSRTTSTWAEQFGRVLVEAMWCHTPVIESDSGEIPWVIGTTGGGVVFPEGDIAALAGAIDELRDSPGRRAELASHGRRTVESTFTASAVSTVLAQWLASASRTQVS